MGNCSPNVSDDLKSLSVPVLYMSTHYTRTRRCGRICLISSVHSFGLVLGGFNEKEHRYFWWVPDRAKNVFFELVRVGFYNPDAISGFDEFLVFEILG